MKSKKVQVRLIESLKSAAQAADKKYADALKESDRICRRLDKAASRKGSTAATDALCDQVNQASAEARRHKYTAFEARSKLLKFRNAASKRRKFPAMKSKGR